MEIKKKKAGKMKKLKLRKLVSKKRLLYRQIIQKLKPMFLKILEFKNGLTRPERMLAIFLIS
nr:MAG TPA: hypothetical protein [Caudoviricetes sp.]